MAGRVSLAQLAGNLATSFRQIARSKTGSWIAKEFLTLVLENLEISRMTEISEVIKGAESGVEGNSNSWRQIFKKMVHYAQMTPQAGRAKALLAEAVLHPVKPTPALLRLYPKRLAAQHDSYPETSIVLSLIVAAMARINPTKNKKKGEDSQDEEDENEELTTEEVEAVTVALETLGNMSEADIAKLMQKILGENWLQEYQRSLISAPGGALSLTGRPFSSLSSPFPSSDDTNGRYRLD